jgi:lactoylglutathione lyase
MAGWGAHEGPAVASPPRGSRAVRAVGAVQPISTSKAKTRWLSHNGTDQLLQLEKPVGLRATYLFRDGLVLELLDYSKRQVHTGPDRVMDEVGVTHLSLSVSDLAAVLMMVDHFGGTVVESTVTEQSAMIRDPDGQLIELLADSWLAVLPPRR